MFKKANVIVVTLFITLIIWLIWLLVTKYIYNLVQISSENYKYYKAYYIWYAGVELDLLKMKNHWMWFEDYINSNSSTVTNNFSWIDYKFSVSTKSLSKQVMNNPLVFIFSWADYCANKKNWISLNTWDAILLPLFYDKQNSYPAKLSWENYTKLWVSFSDLNIYYSGYILVSYQTQDQSLNSKKTLNWEWNNDVSNILWSNSATVLDKPFLVIWWAWKWSFCLSSSNGKLVNLYSYILSEWEYMWRKVVLNVAKKNKWANFSIYWIY